MMKSNTYIVHFIDDFHIDIMKMFEDYENVRVYETVNVTAKEINDDDTLFKIVE